MSSTTSAAPALFALGQVEVSDRAAAALAVAGASLAEWLARHQSGDWLAEGEAAQRHNEFAARHGLLVASEYALPDGRVILLVTAQDRSHTRVMLKDEFQYAEVGLREGYGRWAERYDAWKNPLIAVEAPVVGRLLERVDFRTALDAGTGTGRHAFALAERCARVVGLDLSAEMLRVAQAKARLGTGELTLACASLESPLPLPAGRFDLVLCSLALSHVAGLRECLAEFARVQARPGYCLISEFHPEAIAGRWRTSLSEPEGVFRLPNNAHTRDDYLDGLRAAGYTIREALDLRVKDVPDGYFAPDLLAQFGERGLCLVILAELAASA